MTSSSSPPDLARALADAAQLIDAAITLEDTLDAIAHAARASVPGFDHVGISVVADDGTVTTVSATGPLVRELEALQVDLRQGPMVDALQGAGVVMTDDLAPETRWPQYSPHALGAGVRAQLAARLQSGDELLGSLDLYSTTGRPDPSAARHAELFATHAALALAHARHADLTDEAVPERQLLGMAVGILMERFEIPHDRALYYLVRVASAGRVELRDVAREIVEQVTVRASVADGQPA